MESILDSVKKLLGLELVNEFDQDIIMHINAAISTLTQIGVGPKESFTITDSASTYEDFLGESNPEAINQVKLYLYYKTKLGFDPPQSSAVMECVKAMISEAEWRLNVMCDHKNKKPGIENVGGEQNDS